MKSRSLILFFIFSISLYSCLPSRRERPRTPQPVPYSIVASSPLFTKKYVTITIDSLDNTLQIRMNLKNMDDFPFPISKRYNNNDTLRQTAFRFDFYTDGKMITSDYNVLTNSFRGLSVPRAQTEMLSICSDTTGIGYTFDYELKLPMYAFHTLRSGKHKIELRIHQDRFTERVKIPLPEGKWDWGYAYAMESKLSANLSFDVNIPVVYKSMLYGYGLGLKNDSTFSPVGMDNTIWNSSYPDIYWALFYPKDEFYCQTPYETSTDTYHGKDTFCLYHYYANDSIGIGVYDHDNLSRDDGLGYWYGAMNFLEREPLRRISFDNIQYFDVKMKQIGVVN